MSVFGFVGKTDFECIMEIDAVLVAAGWPPLSPWWIDSIRQIYDSRTRNAVVRGGRRGGKSSSIAGRVAVYEAISGRHVVPPGDDGYFAIVSADKDQAQERLETCHKALNVLSVAHRKTANEITINDTNVGIKCFAATTSAVVSFTSIGFLADEMAMWRDKDSAANPAKEIVGLLRPTMATMPKAIGWYVSAPWSTLDLHHEMVEAGSNASQVVIVGTTPQMNPTLTDKMIVALEPDEPTRRRAYYCEPMSSDETKFFPTEFIESAANFSTDKPWGSPDRAVGGADFAFRRNSSAMVVLSDYRASHKALRLVESEERIPGKVALKPNATIKDLIGIAHIAGADSVACDLHYIETVREAIEDIPIGLLEFPTSNDEIAKAYIRLRVLLSEGMIDLSLAPKKLIDQLKRTTQKPGDGATLVIRNPVEGGAHGDNVSALVCASWAIDQPVKVDDKFSTGDRRFGRAVDGPGDDDPDWEGWAPGGFR